MPFDHRFFQSVIFSLLGLAATATAAPPTPAIAPGILGREVNPFVGTGGIVYLCGNNFPGATVPFGMVRLSPDTVSSVGKRASNSSGYYYQDPKILGFSHTRLAGTGATDGGTFLVIPSNDSTVNAHRRGLNEDYSHENELAFPGYYGITLKKPNVTAELTATEHVGLHRYTFAPEENPRLIIHVSSILGKGTTRSGLVRIDSQKNRIEGSVKTYGTFSGRYGGLTVYFSAQFNRPIQTSEIWSGDTAATNQSESTGDDVGIDLGFAADANQRPIELKLAISCVSIENARKNLEQEVGDANFDKILTRTISEWEKKLSLIQITGGLPVQRKIFLTALYHSLQMPTTFSDANGDYLGFDKQVHRANGFTYYSDLSLWDTFRTVHPLYNLIVRKEQRDMVVSLISMAEQGGYLPRWPSGGGYTGSMFGSPADMTITESYLKGIRDFDVETAFRYMKKTALAPVPAGAPFSGRVGIEHYLKYDYCPSDLMKKSVASTIEYAYADHSIAKLAEALGHVDDASLFEKHARSYRNLFNPETQFFQPRHSTGEFSSAFQPDLMTYLDFSGKMTHAYVEGSAWQWRWGIPSDADEVVKLFKSREYFVEQLNEFFEKSPPSLNMNPNSFYWQGNQPDIYSAYLFNHAGRPDLTQKWVRWILKSKYSDREFGLDGNDDGGTLSAWYVFSSLGLYPTAGTDRYEIGTPLWKRSEIQIDDHQLIILADDADENHPYVRRVLLNDQPVVKNWLSHAEIASGGTLKFEMSDQPVSNR